ncbi:MAG: hypothetical protein WAX89_04550 [Alphaproteobacteria bacterium]
MLFHRFATLTRQLRNQHGAMFGMDARIALIVASVLAATGGITLMSRLDRQKVDASEQALVALREGLNTYYRTQGITELPDNIDMLFQSGIVEDNTFRTDAWGNPWQYAQVTENIKIEQTDVAMKYAVVYSGGKDGVVDTAPITSGEEFAAWQTGNDDIGTKYSSRDVELKRIEEYRARAQLILDKLTTAESANYLEANSACSGTTPPTWCEDEESKNYTQFNYYPRADADTSEAVMYYTTVKGNGEATTYAAGNLNDMQQLMKDIGLPIAYAKDPWGRTLFYHSNITGRDDPPFSASICYSSGASCF